MKKVLTFGSYVLVALLATLITLFLSEGFDGGQPQKLGAMQQLIQERFIGEVEQTELEDAAAQAMVQAMGDRWSHYIPASAYGAYQEQSENAFVGVGITIQQSEQGLVVVEVTEGGSAQSAGVQQGDLLESVDGQSVAQMTTAQVRDLVRGEEGTSVRLGLLRQAEALEVTAVRRRIEVPVASGQMLPGNVGLVAIENFDDRCAKETIAAVEELLQQGAQALILDVRDNPGGYAHEMVEVLDYLLPEGELFRTLSYDGTETVDRSDPEHLDLPMAVLVNADSYSAAEFFAAALQEYGAAVVVGEQTSGKGFFQNTFRFDDGSALALSVGKYFTPKGRSLEGAGIQPDVPVTVDADTAAAIYYDLLKPEEDPQIQAARESLNRP